ncbi:GTP cyclohydrolase [Chitinophaga oryziterrae]|uniref:GTP cyclohydrolase n=1 Tax=Chitinophaga oryziterrae TaxID=1031224 RepID=A0A6N8JIW0_9BACT|nr:YciI family protein [Chitinophaga oryziterrae]MVT44286.1 GTP cyclohydrolase [Chitinophaga oryziterrae]
MYLIMLQYIRPVAAVEHYMDQHRAFLDKFYKSGQFILAGRRKPKSGGVILCKASSRKEVEQIMSEDPLDKYQLALYEIIEFEPTSYINELQAYLS